MAVGAAERRQAQIPSSKPGASPSRKQIEPPSVRGKSKIA